MASTSETKNSKKKYFLYLGIIFVATLLSLFMSLHGQFTEVVDSLKSANVAYVLLMVGILAFTYLIEALIIKIFARLYTRKYSIGSGLATSLTGQFFSDITPGSSGGQVMQTYTLRNQGIPVSSGASIFVMMFVLYQSALLIVDVIALLVERSVIGSLSSIRFGDWFEIPLWPIVAIGFFLNVVITFSIFFLSYSKALHHFIIHNCIGFLAKLKLLKDPEKTRDNVRVTVENYRIELRRLQSNIPVTILILILDLLLLFIRDSIPYFAGLALNAYNSNSFDFSKMMDATFLGACHQMITGLIPLPGSAGVSEYFFGTLFSQYFTDTVNTNGEVLRNASVNLASAQILWRTVTFHLMLLVSGIFVSLYRHKPVEEFATANRKTFVTLQLSTMDERRVSSDTMYETSKISRKEIQRRLHNEKKVSLKEKFESRKERIALKKQEEAQKRANLKHNIVKDETDDWDSIDIKI